MLLDIRLRPFYAPDGVKLPGSTNSGTGDGDGDKNEFDVLDIFDSDKGPDADLNDRKASEKGTAISSAEDIVSNIDKFGNDWSGTDDAFQGTGRSRGRLQSDEVAAFDPKINHDWTYPDYKKDKANVKELEQKYKDLNYERAGLNDNPETSTDESKWHDYTKGNKAYRQKKDVKSDYSEKAKKAKEAATKKAIKSAKDRLEEATNKANLDKETELKNKVKEYQNKAVEASAKGDNFAFQWYANQIPKLKEKLASGKYKKSVGEVTTLNLNSKERDSIAKAEKSVLDEQKKALDLLEKSPSFKKDQEDIREAKEAWKAAKKEVAKKQAPYAIRNAFLIIDMIQKSLQNIGRALPKGDYNAPYTETAMEEPNLFKLWREQIEKGQERTQKAESATSDVVYSNIYNKNALPSDTVSHQRDREEKWADKARELKFDQAAQKVYVDTMREVANYAADTISEQDMADMATYNAAKKAGNGDLMDAIEQKWISEHLTSVSKAKRALAITGTVLNPLKEAFKQVGQSAALAAATGGIGNDIFKSLAAVLNGLPDFGNMSSKDITLWIAKVAGGPDQVQQLLDYMRKLDLKSMKTRHKALEKAQKRVAEDEEEYIKWYDYMNERDNKMNAYQAEIAENSNPNSPKYQSMSQGQVETLQRKIDRLNREKTDHFEKFKEAELNYKASQKRQEDLSKELGDMLYRRPTDFDESGSSDEGSI